MSLSIPTPVRTGCLRILPMIDDYQVHELASLIEQEFGRNSI